VHRARTLAVEHGEGAGEHRRQFLDAHQGVAEGVTPALIARWLGNSCR
jgi:hypothetical protein